MNYCYLCSMKICIFCSANSNLDPDFFRMTEELGRWMGENGHAVVFGGCNLGLMACIAKAVHEAGGETIGVVPSIIEEGGRVSPDVTTHIPCDNLSERKDILIGTSDIIVALPGGIGTLDEIFTVLSAATIGYHRKRVVLYNMKNFWQPLLKMLDEMDKKGVLREGWRNQLIVANSLEEIIKSCEK